MYCLHPITEPVIYSLISWSKNNIKLKDSPALDEFFLEDQLLFQNRILK
jgi:hypothetical protein